MRLSSEQNRLEREARLTDLTTQYSQLKLPASPVLETLWQKTQIEMIHIFMEKESRSTRDNLFKLTRNPYIKMILVQSQAMYAYRGDEKALIALMDKLVKWKQPELEKLAVYYASDPRPSYDMLNRLLDRPDCETTDALIHQFESVEQGLNPNGTSKRQYSVTKIDREI